MSKNAVKSLDLAMLKTLDRRANPIVGELAEELEAGFQPRCCMVAGRCAVDGASERVDGFMGRLRGFEVAIADGAL
jgi:hypothetical protein